MFVNFGAQWCKPCKAIAPTFVSLASSLGNAVYIKVDVDAEDLQVCLAAVDLGGLGVLVGSCLDVWEGVNVLLWRCRAPRCALRGRVPSP